MRPAQARARHRRLFALGLQRAIDGFPYLVDRLGAGDPFAVDEERGSAIDVQMIGFLHRREHRAVVLLLQAGIKLGGVDFILRALLPGEAVERGACLGYVAVGSADLIAVAMHVVHKRPVGCATLVGEAICIDRRMHRPRMNLDQGVVFINHLD